MCGHPAAELARGGQVKGGDIRCLLYVDPERKGRAARPSSHVGMLLPMEVEYEGRDQGG